MATALDTSVFPRMLNRAWCERNGYIRLYDATGALIPHAIRCDRLTGEVEQYHLDEHGRKHATPEGEAAREVMFYPAPLRAEFIDANPPT